MISFALFRIAVFKRHSTSIPDCCQAVSRRILPISKNNFVMKNGYSDGSLASESSKTPTDRQSPSRAPPSPEHRAPTTPCDAPPDMWFVEYLTPNDAYHHGVRELLYSQRSHFQSVTVADTGPYGRALFLDGKIQTAEGDEALYHEPLVHVPCVAHGQPERVLVLGGGDGGVARELLRWNSVQAVVVVDIDEMVVEACRKYLPKISAGALEDPRCRMVIGDALHFVAKTEEQFDVIICDLTDPMEDSPSLALFTREFFSTLKNRLLPGGTLSIQVGPASLVESPKLMPRICRTLALVFGKAYPYQVFVPTYGSPLGMAVATDSLKGLPREADVDRMFDSELNSSLTVLDGRAFRGLFAVPRHIRKAIEEEQGFLTEKNTANAFGKGILNSQ